MTSFHAENEHAELVARLAKPPYAVLATILPSQMDLVHAALGVAGEAGELVDAIKKAAIYNKPLDVENVVEELGDLEFYMAMIRRTLRIPREVVLRHNITKLRKRYPAGYTDQAAQDRADKAAVGAGDLAQALSPADVFERDFEAGRQKAAERDPRAAMAEGKK